MKKVLFAILAALFLCACEGKQGPQGPQGVGTNWKIVDLNVDYWDYTNYTDNNFYYAKFDVPALTSYVYANGNVQVYFLDNNKQEQLPVVLHQYDVLQDQSIYLFTRTINATFGIGWVQVEVRDSDFQYEVDPSLAPKAASFRVVLTYL